MPLMNSKGLNPAALLSSLLYPQQQTPSVAAAQQPQSSVQNPAAPVSNLAAFTSALLANPSLLAAAAAALSAVSASAINLNGPGSNPANSSPVLPATSAGQLKTPRTMQ